MILPEGIRKDLHEGLKGLAEKYEVFIVVIEDVNWNDDLTPWPTLSRCFWSIITGRSIFPAITRRPPMKSATGMFPWPNKC